MTKLKRKLKQASKRRQHRANVQKRKIQRAEKAVKEEEEKRADREDAEVALEEAEMDGDSKIIEAAKKMVSSIVSIEKPSNKRKATKKMSRKQEKRKSKGQERGQARTEQLDKKSLVKQRKVILRQAVHSEE